MKKFWKNFKLRAALFRIWFLKNIIIFIEITFIVLLGLTLGGILPEGFPIFGPLAQSIRECFEPVTVDGQEVVKSPAWLKVITTLITVLSSTSLIITKTKSIALNDIKSEKLKIALVRAGLYFNEKGKLVKKVEKVANRDFDGDGKIGDGEKAIEKTHFTIRLFSGIKNAIQEFFAIATVKFDDEKEDKEALEEALAAANLTEAAEAVGELEEYIRTGKDSQEETTEEVTSEETIEVPPTEEPEVPEETTETVTVEEEKSEETVVEPQPKRKLSLKERFTTWRDNSRAKRTAKKKIAVNRVFETMSDQSLNELKESVFKMSEMKRGALITIMGKDNIFTNGSVTQRGSCLDWEIKAASILDMFIVGAPLHDGATIIDGNKIVRGAVFFKSTAKEHKEKFGARHQAAEGISNNSDAITILVSEETGDVLVFFKGIKEKVSAETFVSTIKRCYSWINLLPSKQETTEEKKVIDLREEGFENSPIKEEPAIEIHVEEKKVEETPVVKQQPQPVFNSRSEKMAALFKNNNIKQETQKKEVDDFLSKLRRK